MAARSRTLLLIAAAAVLAVAPQLTAAQETVNLYGLTLPPLSNYLNWTMDISDIQRLTGQGKFADASTIYFNGKNNFRNGVPRKMSDFSRRNLAVEGPKSFWAVYSKHFNNPAYLMELLEAPLNASCGFSCCGVRDAAMRIYNRLWVIAYAQHEMDEGIITGAADEASHGFAMYASPNAQRDNQWNWVRQNSLAACIPEVQDSVDPNTGVGTTERFAPSNIAYRNYVAQLEAAIKSESEAVVDAVRAGFEKTIATQFLMAVMVNAKKATGRASGLECSPCYNVCGLGAHQAAAAAAWKSAAPLVARAGPSAQAAINAIPELLVLPMPTTNFPAIRSNVATVAAALGIDFNTEVYRCP